VADADETAQGRAADGAKDSATHGAMNGAAPSLGEPLLCAKAVAAHLDCDVSTVYRLAGRAGGLPVVEVAPRVRRFRPEDVRAFVAARTKSPQMASEARNLLGSMNKPPVDLPRIRARRERTSGVAARGKLPAPRGGR